MSVSLGLSHTAVTTTTVTTTNTSAAGISATVGIVYLAIILVLVVSLWKIFNKAGKPGWASIVPFYNTFVQLEIVGRPAWWFVLLLVPFVNFIVAIIILNDLCKAFGKGSGFFVLLLLLPIIGYPLLAFGDATYVGPTAGGAAPQPQPAMGPTAPAPVAVAPTAAPAPAPQDPTAPTPPPSNV